MKVLGLFSGVGGFELGLQRAGFDISAMCEIEEPATRVLNKNFPNVPIFDNVKTLHLKGGEYDVMCGGFPCQDISVGGKGAGITGERSGLWKEYLRLIDEGRPKYAIIENVFAILGRGIEVVLHDLAQIGFDATWTIYDSKFFGVPQRRRRVYIVAVRDGIPLGTEIFKFRERDTAEHRREVESVNKSFRWSFEAEPERGQEGFTYITRQSNAEFTESGLASTLCKRDYKQFTDLVITNDRIRRVTPTERLLLQSFPSDWFDGCNLTDTQKFVYNGMTVNVIQHVGELIREFDDAQQV